MCFIQMVDKPKFKDLIYTLKTRMKIPGNRDLIGILEEIGTGLPADNASTLRDKHHDSWLDLLRE